MFLPGLFDRSTSQPSEHHARAVCSESLDNLETQSSLPTPWVAVVGQVTDPRCACLECLPDMATAAHVCMDVWTAAHVQIQRCHQGPGPTLDVHA